MTHDHIKSFIERCRSRLSKATPGPWTSDGKNITSVVLKDVACTHYKNTGTTFTKQFGIVRKPNRTPDCPISHEQFYANFELIASAPTDLKLLCDALEVAVEKLEHSEAIIASHERMLAEKGVRVFGGNPAEKALTQISALLKEAGE